MPITEPGLYDLSDAEYQSDPCAEISLRSSTAWVMHDKTPAHAAWSCARLNPLWTAPEEKAYFNIGKIAHTLLLGKGAGFAIVHHDDYRKAEARVERDAITEAGKVPLKAGEAAQVRAMAKAATQQIAGMVAAGTIEASPFDSAKSEQVIVWRDHGVLCRAMLDGLSIAEDAMDEYKTDGTDISPNAWQWRARKLGYIFRLAFYRRGLEALKLAYSPTIRVFVQSSEPPYLMALYRIDDELIARADQQVIAALKLWRRCLEKNSWPGYPVEGFELGLLDRERAQEQATTSKSAHVYSEDVPDDAYSKPNIPRRPKK